MDRDEIIRMAKEVGWTIGPATLSGLERFASLVATQNRPWVGLTDDEMDEIVDRVARYELIRTVEAKLKEKNGG
jgi:hypothetical protein